MLPTRLLPLLYACVLPCNVQNHRLHDHAGGAGGLGTAATGSFSAYSASLKSVVETAKAGPDAATTALQGFLASSVTKIEALGPAGGLYFGLLYVLAEVLVIPAIPLTTAAGFLFGVAGGTAVVLTSASIAAAISFQLGRTLLRWAPPHVRPRFEINNKFTNMPVCRPTPTSERISNTEYIKRCCSKDSPLLSHCPHPLRPLVSFSRRPPPKHRNIYCNVRREPVEGLLDENPKFRALDTAIAKEGFKVILLLRLSPIFPFALSNYLYGVTSVDFSEYMMGTLIGFFPGTLAYVYGGTVGVVAVRTYSCCRCCRCFHKPTAACQPHRYCCLLSNQTKRTKKTCFFFVDIHGATAVQGSFLSADQ